MKVIKSEPAYQKALKRTMAIFQANEGTPESDELALLLVSIKDYEDKHSSIISPKPNPTAIKAMDEVKKGGTKEHKNSKAPLSFLNKRV